MKMIRLKGKRAALFLLGFVSMLFIVSNITLFAKVTKEDNSLKTNHVIKEFGYEWRDLRTPLQRYVGHVGMETSRFRCSSLFGQDKNELGRTQKYLEDREYSFSAFNENLFPKVTLDCEAFKRDLGYMKPYSNLELEFPLAFSILTNDKIEEVERLLRMIYAPQNIYCIHVDLKASPVFRYSVQLLTRCFPNVFVASRLENVVYEHFSRLRAELNCIEDLLLYGRTWRYLLNFASSEIPLKTNLEIVNILKNMNGSNDIREVYRNRRMERFQYYHVLFEGTVQKSKQRLSPPPHNLTITKGLAYGVFSREFLEFSLTSQMAQDFLHWTKDTHSPDEHYWATLNNLYHNPFLNSPGGSKVHPDKKTFISRFVIWKSNHGHKYKCHGKYRHNICIFGLGDLPSLKDSAKLVANKFDILYDPVTYACMEEYLRNKTFSQYQKINL